MSIAQIQYYYYTHFGLLNTVEVIVQSFIELIRNKEFGSWVDG